MSAAKVPREFKFVSAYSRKRRRRNRPSAYGPTFCLTGGALRSASRTATAPTRQQKSSPTSASREDDNTAEDMVSTAPFPPINLTLTDSARPCLADARDEEAVRDAIPLPLAEAFCQEDGIDWPYISLMNSFTNSGQSLVPRADSLGGFDQFPVYFEPDMPLISPDETSPSENSPPDQEPALAPSSVEHIILPRIDSQHASCIMASATTQLLSRYDQEFCILPLTHDFDANPFRFDIETARSSQLLLHSILALSYKHINRDTGSWANESTNHKRKALRMLSDIETTSQVSKLDTTTLDAALILITLDCATSAHGPWVAHLKRAYGMIQATEAVGLARTPRMQARLEMLVWWDVTLALTSRKGCVLSELSIINFLNRNGDDDKTFYGVSGCPEALFRHMIRLGTYAREIEVVASMTCAKFDLEPVLVVEHDILAWTDPGYYGLNSFEGADSWDTDLEDMAHCKEDFYHCTEAWRYALLIYIARVFKWKRDGPAPPVLCFLARKTLNHVQSCRYTSMLQKQLLLPVFLAGCETKDQHLRGIARTYCSWWNERTRYDMFLTAKVVLEEVWDSDSPQTWWGSVIDQNSRPHEGADARQYLFG